MPKAKRPYPHYKFPHEIEIVYSVLSASQCHWLNVPEQSYDLMCSNYSWFPTDAIMTVKNGKYVDSYNIGAVISGNMGTASIAVRDINRAIELLNKKGYFNIKPAQ